MLKSLQNLYALKSLQFEVTGRIYQVISFFSQVLLSDLMKKELNLCPTFFFFFLFAASSLTARKIKDKEEREK